MVSLRVALQVSCTYEKKRFCRSAASTELLTYRPNDCTCPIMKDARPSPPPFGPAVVVGSNVNCPERWVSLGTRRFCWKRQSAPNFSEWSPKMWVTLATPWNSFSCSFSGQLHELMPSEYPKLKAPVPFRVNAGIPDV